MISRNAVSIDVVKIQARLRALGYKDKVIDGIFDPITENYVKQFQKKNGLYVDGIVGPNTASLLVKLTRDKHLFTIIHCSATPEGRGIKAETVLRYHTITKKWSRPGYSDILELNGNLVNIRPYNSDNLIQNWEYTFGVKGALVMNKNSRHVCYIGGTDKNGNAKDTRTIRQKDSLETYIKYEILRNPDVLILGHNQLQYKACPSFNVPNWMYDIKCSSKNYLTTELKKV